MTSSKTLIFKFIVVTAILGLFSVAQIALAATPPTLTKATLSTSSLARGGILQISGQNLLENVKLTSSTGTSTTIKGTITEAGTNLIVNIPITITSGIYAVAISSDNGFLDIPQKLTITDGKPIVPYFPSTYSPSTSLGDLIGMVFNYSLQILGLIVFIMILFSGFQWLLAGGNPGTISKARSRITQTLLGATILLASYLILNTINPDLVKGGFTLEGIKVTGGIPGGVVPPSGGGSLADKANTLISKAGFSTKTDCPGYNAKGNIQDIAAGKLPAVCSYQCASGCTPGGTSGTVTVNSKILDGLINLPFQFTVTSLTTGSHTSTSKHYTGNAVDIVVSSNNSRVWQEARDVLKSNGGTAFCEDKKGQAVPSCDTTVADHIHWEL